MSTFSAIASPSALRSIPLTDRSAKAVIDLVVESLDGTTATGNGTGYVICAGGRYERYGYMTCRWIREQLKDDAPIEIWVGENEEPVRFCEEVGAVCRIADVPGGWPLKARAVRSSAFETVLLFDADCLPIIHSSCMDSGEHGAMFFPDVGSHRKSDWAFQALGIKIQPFVELEAGQLLINRVQHAKAVALVDYFNQRPEFFYQHHFGDKDTWALAFMRLGLSFTMGAPCSDQGWGLRHYLPDGTHYSDHLIRVKEGRQYSAVVQDYLEAYRDRFEA
ncbi:MAG TPA: hypothetical protein VMQ76_12680 [Terracidiphilus sp.]|nr:hypothetical protein [Terracidiphilus sp.]